MVIQNYTLHFTFIKESDFQKSLRYEVLTAQRRYIYMYVYTPKYDGKANPNNGVYSVTIEKQRKGEGEDAKGESEQ